MRRELAFLSEGRSFDGELCPKAKIDDKRISALCAKMYRIARKNCDSEVERRSVKRVTPAQLEAWGVIAKVRGKWVASNAYALLMGDSAFQTRMKCALFKGNDKKVFLDRREFTGSVMELIEAGLDYILAKINMGCYFKGLFRHDRYELPPDEMRELVVNAFAHRSYLEHDVPVSIAVYDSRVEITSPGGLPRGQTPARAVSGYSKIRNHVLAKVLNYMRFIEEWGSGLKRVNDVLEEYGIGRIGIEDVGFAVKMSVNRVVGVADEPVNEVVNAESGDGKRSCEPVNEVVNAENGAEKRAGEAVNEVVNAENGIGKRLGKAVSEVVKEVYDGIRLNPGIRKPQLLKIVGASRATVERAIARLRELRKVEFRGATKTGGYYCIG